MLVARQRRRARHIRHFRSTRTRPEDHVQAILLGDDSFLLVLALPEGGSCLTDKRTRRSAPEQGQESWLSLGDGVRRCWIAFLAASWSLRDDKF